MRGFTAGAVVLAAAAAMLMASSAAAAELVYQNDSFGETPEGDGVVECGFAVDEKFGALFVPDEADYPFSITNIRFALFPFQLDTGSCVEATARTGVPVTIEIWNDADVAEAPDGDPIYSSTEWTVETSTDGLIDLPVGDEGDLTISSGVIRLVVTIRALDSMPIRDDDGITAERNLILDAGGTWHWSSDYGVAGDWLLRLVVDTLGTSEPDEVEPAPDTAEDAIMDVVEPEDAPADLPADVVEDAPEDVPDEGDERLGGGGCSCALATGGSTIPPLLGVLLVILGLSARPRRRF